MVDTWGGRNGRARVQHYARLTGRRRLCVFARGGGTQLWMVQVVVAILDPLRKVLSFSHVEIQYKLEIDSQLPCAKE